MASRMKEDERNERTIRSLLKLPANKKCINCNSLGPQYVCTNFWTFVCTTCSGIHREFTHRVKSVSMAKFTTQEVSSLQSGGNERAKSIYFKDWDSKCHSYPDSSNINRLRDFIRHVYVDRRFSGEKSSEKCPRGEDSYEYKSDAFRGGSMSPPYEDSYNHRRNDRPSPGGRSDDSYSKYDDRSPAHDRDSRYSSDQGRSPNRPEVINDWRREDRFGNRRKPEDHRTSDGDTLSEGRSPDYQKDINVSSPPVMRPVREILRDNIIPPMIDPPKPNGIRTADAAGHVVRTPSSSSFGSSDGNQVESKRETLGSLIDFDADPEPPANETTKPQEQVSPVLTATQPTSSTSNDNWASFDFSTEAKVSQCQAASSNTLDSLLTQLTAPSLVPAESGQSHNSNAGGLVPIPPFINAEGFTSAPVSNGATFNNMNVSASWPAVHHQQQPHKFPTDSFPATSSQQPSNFPAAQVPHSISMTAHVPANGFETQPHKEETKSSGRSALPEDLFAATYHQPLSAQGWHTNQPPRMGFAMHYNVPAPTYNFQQPSKSSNPFDIGNESLAAPAPSFPSMASLHGALPTMSQQPTSFVHGAPSPAYMQHQMPSHTSQVPPYAAGMASGAYFGQQVAQSTPALRPQEAGAIPPDSSFFGSANPNHWVASNTAPAAPNSFPSGGGNPFG